jgi:fumarylacetoacetase
VSAGFGLDHLPYGVVARAGEPPRCAVRLGDHAVDLQALQRAGLLGELPEGVFAGPVLNPFLALGRAAWEATRARLQELLAADAAPLIPLADTEPRLPVAVGDYVDFYSSLEHATNVGRLFRPDSDPLHPNWRRLPVGYQGRAGSVVVTGTPIHRPRGQSPPPAPGGAPSFGPSRELDVELELGFITGDGPPLGTPIPAAGVREHVFGFVLVNDWSARDLQRWEYRPLGPFLGKSFATSISAWVTPLAALEPYLVAGRPQDPAPLEYLRADGAWALDAELTVELDGETISATNARGLYWTFPQQLAHATVNGARVRAGDLFASGTISGAEPGSEGSLIERYRNARFLADGDTVVLRGSCGGGALALGEVAGTVRRALPATVTPWRAAGSAT